MQSIREGHFWKSLSFARAGGEFTCRLLDLELGQDWRNRCAGVTVLVSLHVSLAGLLNHKGLLGTWEPASDDFCLTLFLPSLSLCHVILKQQSPFHCETQLFKWVPRHLSEGVGLMAGWAGRRWLNKNREKEGVRKGEKKSQWFF